jgi:hypothetical protein
MRGIGQPVAEQVANLSHPVANRLRVHMHGGGHVVASALVQ